jgi:hypothetical protein
MSATTREIPAAEGGTVGEKVVRKFAEMTTSTPFRDLLHAANLRHGTDGLTTEAARKENIMEILSNIHSDRK